MVHAISNHSLESVLKMISRTWRSVLLLTRQTLITQTNGKKTDANGHVKECESDPEDSGKNVLNACICRHLLGPKTRARAGNNLLAGIDHS